MHGQTREVADLVHIGGVLLVFSYLIIPAVCANFLARKLGALLAVGCGLSTLCSLIGSYCSYVFNWPIGAAIVCSLGAALVAVAIAIQFKRS